MAGPDFATRHLPAWALGVIGVGLIAATWSLVTWLEPASPDPQVGSEGPREVTAEFRSVNGSVSWHSIGQLDWKAATLEVRLRKGDQVRTGSDGSAVIRFFDGTVLTTRPDSLISIADTSEDPFTRRRKVAWRVASGEVNFETGRRNVPGSTTVVFTPGATAQPEEGARAAVRVDEAGDSDIRFFEGRSQVETVGGQRVVLVANQGLKVGRTGEASAPRALPGVPVLSAPSPDTTFTYEDVITAVTVLAWERVGGAESYRVMVDLTPAFSRPLLDRSDVRRASWDLPGLRGGEYYWRVAAVKEGGVEGDFSETRRFTVFDPHGSQADVPLGAPPPLRSSVEVLGGTVRVKGRTAPGSRVTVDGIPIAVAKDGTFLEYVVLTRPGRTTLSVRAFAPDGAQVEERHTVETKS